MIPGPLLRAKTGRDRVEPSFVGERPLALDAAGALLDIYRIAADEGWPRARVEEAVAGAIGDSKDHKLWKGLAKVLDDRCEYVVAGVEDPVATRLAVFRAAAKVGPLALEPGPFERPVAEGVLDAEAAARGMGAQALSDALYADRSDEQRLKICPVPDAAWLVRRYDVALAQSVLLHATEVRVVLSAPAAPRVHQLFRWIKFLQLVHSFKRVGDEVHITLDGPVSVLTQSTRYGMKLAQLLPALLLQPGEWELTADLAWTRRNLRRQLLLHAADGLVSHLSDTGAYVGREQQAFAERFADTVTGWTLSDATEPLDLDGRALVLPDFGISDGRRTAWLEVVGYWRRDWLARRVELLRKHGPGNLILAISRKLLTGPEGDELAAEFPGAVVPFKEVVPVKAVMEAVARVAR